MIWYHFHTHTEFDVAVQKQRQSEGPYVYLAVNRGVARDKKFKIILRHPISSGSKIKILEYDEGFSQKYTSTCSIIFIHQVGKDYEKRKIKSKHKPKLSLAALLLLDIKRGLRTGFFNQITLQKTAFFMNMKLTNPYFHFKKYKFGPYNHSIDIISRNIKEHVEYHSIQDVETAY